MVDDPHSLLDPVDPTRAPEPQPVSQAVGRFRSCRWRKEPEDGVVEHCTHRDVLPLAGATGFNPQAWCPDCTYYKARRTPRKRSDNDNRVLAAGSFGSSCSSRCPGSASFEIGYRESSYSLNSRARSTHSPLGASC